MAATPDPDGPELLHLWSLRDDVHLEPDGPDGDLLLHSRWGSDRLVRPDRATCEALRRMTLGPILLHNVLGGAGPEAERRLTGVLEGVQHLVVRSIGLTDSELPLISLTPMSPLARLDPVEPEPDQSVRLSRFTSVRSSGRGFTLESPLSLFRVIVHRRAAAELLGSLGWTRTPAELAKVLPLPECAVRAIVAHLLSTGMLIAGSLRETGAEPVFAENSDPALTIWSATDLGFHVRTTAGRHDHDLGATYPHAGRIAPEPALKPVPGGPRYRLPRPVLRELLSSDPPLTAVLETRRPALAAGPDQGVTISQLGELLFRSLRVRSVSLDEACPTPYQVSDRPYTSVSGSHPLEAYVSTNRCTGLPDGTFHYDPLLHSLTLVNGNDGELAELSTAARTNAGLAAPAPVTITLTARFPRVNWKFSGTGYALMLRDTGMAMQTLCLVAAAMGLAAATVDHTEIDRTARMVGVDWRAESPVGQLVLGAGVRRVDADDRLTSITYPQS